MPILPPSYLTRYPRLIPFSRLRGICCQTRMPQTRGDCIAAVSVLAYHLSITSDERPVESDRVCDTSYCPLFVAPFGELVFERVGKHTRTLGSGSTPGRAASRASRWEEPSA